MNNHHETQFTEEKTDVEKLCDLTKGTIRAGSEPRKNNSALSGSGSVPSLLDSPTCDGRKFIQTKAAQRAQFGAQV